MDSAAEKDRKAKNPNFLIEHLPHGHLQWGHIWTTFKETLGSTRPSIGQTLRGN